MISALIITCDKKPKEILWAVLHRVGFADRVIVADKGQVRTNRSAILSHGADQVCVYPFSPTVEETRMQFVMEYGRDWIILLDDDEILSPDCERVFRGFVEADSADVLEIPIRNHVMGRFDRESPFWPEWRPVLHRRGSLDFASTVHAGVKPTDSARVVRLSEESPAYIDHLSHPNISSWFEKTNRYTDQPDRKTNGSVETTYGGALAWLKQTYNMIDALKRWEETNYPNGEAEFLRIAQEVLRG